MAKKTEKKQQFTNTPNGKGGAADFGGMLDITTGFAVTEPVPPELEKEWEKQWEKQSKTESRTLVYEANEVSPVLPARTWQQEFDELYGHIGVGNTNEILRSILKELVRGRIGG